MKTIGGIMSFQEEGDFLTGQLFYHGALLRSGRLATEATADSYKAIFDIMSKRKYLVIPGHLFVIDHIKQVNTRQPDPARPRNKGKYFLFLSVPR